jgi:hypothetical protein
LGDGLGNTKHTLRSTFYVVEATWEGVVAWAVGFDFVQEGGKVRWDVLCDGLGDGESKNGQYHMHVCRGTLRNEEEQEMGQIPSREVV